MKICRYLFVLVLLGIMSACAHTEHGADLDEDILSLPVEEPVDEVASPGSLWSPSAKFVDMYRDSLARRVGDIVVVQIVESSSAQNEAETAANKSSSVNNSITDVLGLPLDQSSVFGYGITPTVSASTSTEFEADGDTSRKGDISAVISARIVRILPSGNMMISGKKQTRVNSEHQYIIISGIIRPDDITQNNTIQSTYIADMRLDYYGTGIIGDQQKRGVVSRAIDKIWPF
ncbi:MAG TPA: flagellar basal body L-ring protein FlgH [Deltaproteobacteria bacterium]|nr:flagellar basal body L-ring protein FlgH [Deltaproteobacteria bacterium]HPJ92870.1 flagellar basal body L-ring protein FlgH [Deltaproteobacteria bacterium]HPR51037.1 flagellar basal body L-ring protein FlgH [Deltaproteobacteria bacterium]